VPSEPIGDLDVLFFFGDARITKNGGGGHFFYRAVDGCPTWAEGIMAINEAHRARIGGFPVPWTSRELDGALAVAPDIVVYGTIPCDEQPQGRCCLHHKDGWTALSFWDRTGDVRHGSSSTIVARGTFGIAEMLERFKTELPRLWERVNGGGVILYGHQRNADPAPRNRIEVPMRIAAQPTEEKTSPSIANVSDAIEESETVTEVRRVQIGKRTP
jgi:hypothetical protein